MTILSLAAAGMLAPLLALQTAGQTAIAIENDNPETWQVEYPRIIQPLVTDYRKCLNVSDRVISGEANFEVQHRSDIPRCEPVRKALVAASNKELAGVKTTLSPAEVTTLFSQIGTIHIARGRDLDMQFIQRLAGAELAEASYQADRPAPVVIKLEDPSVVKVTRDMPTNTGQTETK